MFDMGSSSRGGSGGRVRCSVWIREGCLEICWMQGGEKWLGDGGEKVVRQRNQDELGEEVFCSSLLDRYHGVLLSQ